MNPHTAPKSSVPEDVRKAVAEAIRLAGGPAKCAKAIGGTTQRWCFYRDGERWLPEKYGARLEQLANGGVTRRDMWPDDYSVIWPEYVTATPALEVAHA